MAAETVGSVLAGSLARAGDRIALRGHHEVRTHRQLLDNASRFANALAGRGLVPGEHVGLMVGDRVEAVEAYLGCLLGGFPAIHVNDRLGAAEVTSILAVADTRAFVYTGDLAGTVAAVDATESMRVTVGISAQAAGTHDDWAALIGRSSRATPEVSRAADDLAIVGFTSGSTGAPKGVMHTQQTLLRMLRHMPVHFDLRPRSRCSFTGTLSFVTAIWGVVLPHLYLGGEVSFMAGLDAQEWFTRMQAEGSQFTYIPTPRANDFLEQVRRQPRALETLRCAMHSGSKMSAATVQRLVEAIGPRFAEAYGMTETGAPVTRTETDDWGSGCDAHDVYASTGRPVHIAELAVLDTAGVAQPAGTTGEVAVRCDTQFSGYYRQPELTAETVVDGWLRTGDIGWLDEAGYLYITDRSKDMIISGGMNVYPAEVEVALEDMPGVVELAVIGVADERWGETVTAVVVASDPALDETAVIAAARARIASYKKPTQVRFVAALPRTASLKVDKPALRGQWQRGELTDRGGTR